MVERVGVGVVLRRWRVVRDAVVVVLQLSESLLFLALHLSPLGTSILEPNLGKKREKNIRAEWLSGRNA